VGATHYFDNQSYYVGSVGHSRPAVVFGA